MNFNHNDKIKLIVSDVDGTLVDPYKKITPRTVAAVTAAQDTGCMVAIASGRTMCEMGEIIEKLPNVHYFICSNGAFVLDTSTERVVYNETFTIEETLYLLSKLEQFDTFCEVYVGADIYGDRGKLTNFEAYVNAEISPLLRATRTFIDDLEAYIQQHNKGAEKVQTFYGTVANKHHIVELFSQNPRFEVIESSEGNIEIVPQGISKGRAVENLAKSLGLTAANVATFGDSNNDLSMLRYAGISFSMANGEETAKAAGKYMTASNADDGVAIGIEAILEHNKRVAETSVAEIPITSSFYITDVCVTCGACAMDCPVQAITPGKDKYMIGKGCINCGDCYEICPVGAVVKKEQ